MNEVRTRGKCCVRGMQLQPRAVARRQQMRKQMSQSASPKNDLLF